jgi:alpha-mannosidase
MLTDGMDYVEVEYVVGSVPVDDGIGKEVKSKYLTTIKSQGFFYTDSNGSVWL